MKLHLRHPENKKKTRCGRTAKRTEIACPSTPTVDVCSRCQRSWDAENEEFVELARIIGDAWWRATGKLL